MKTDLTNLLVLVAINLTFLAGCSSPDKEEKKPAEQPTVTKSNKQPLEITPIDLLISRTGIQGKVTLIEFGTIGCELSQEGHARLQELHKNNTHPDLSYVIVEAPKDKDKVSEYFSKAAPDIQVVLDQGQMFARSFDSMAFPSYVLLDKFGRIRYRGGFPPEQYPQWVKEMVTEQEDQGPDAPLFGTVTLDIPKLLETTQLPVFAADKKCKIVEYMGKTGLLILFVDTDCPFSKQAAADIPSVVPVLQKQDIKLVLINLGNSVEKVKKRYGNDDLQAPLLYDTSSNIKTNWNIASVPTILLLTPDGKIVYSGSAEWKKMAAAAEPELNLESGSLRFTVEGTGSG